MVDLEVLLPMKIVEVHLRGRRGSELALVGGIVSEAKVAPVGAPALRVMVVGVIPDGRIVGNPPDLDRFSLPGLKRSVWAEIGFT